MMPSNTVWAVLCVVLASSLVSARPSPEAEADAGYRSPADTDDESTLIAEARSQNSISAEEREADERPQPYGALKLAVAEEPWGALKVAMALAEQDRQASQRLNKERESVEVAATPDPDSEVVESEAIVPLADSPSSNGPTTLVLRPYAKAVAGAGGTAIAMPQSQAVTRRHGDVVVFEPRAIAVAGPGGHAIASSKLTIDTLIQ